MTPLEIIASDEKLLAMLSTLQRLQPDSFAENLTHAIRHEITSIKAHSDRKK